MDLGVAFALELVRVSRRWRVRLDERVKHTGLTQARWITLLELSRSGPMSQRELADKIGLEGPTVVRLLDALEKKGLAERRRCGGDRRVNKIHLSQAAQPLLQEITTISDNLRADILADISAADLSTAHRVLRLIGDQLEKQ